MSSSGHPHYLEGLTTREQIADVIHRCCLGIDLNDVAMFESCFAVSDPNVTFDMNGRVLTGMDSIISDSFNVVGPMDTQHLTTGIRIDVHDGDSTARLTANALNQHFRAGQGMVPDAPHLLAAHRYDIEMVKDSTDQWRIQTWRLKTVWSQGTWDVMKPETREREEMEGDRGTDRARTRRS